jgi:hypothetical protein
VAGIGEQVSNFGLHSGVCKITRIDAFLPLHLVQKCILAENSNDRSVQAQMMVV